MFCTHSKMEDHESQSLRSLTDKMNAAHVEDPCSGSEKNGAPNTKDSSGADETPGLSNLAGELQNLIITNLHPSAAIALSQTNRHFHSCAHLHRLPSPTVFDYLQEKELLPIKLDDYACYTCLRFKPRPTFGTRQTRSILEKLGQSAHKRYCFECGSMPGNHLPC